jgi:SAM-dependent methyltransferase
VTCGLCGGHAAIRLFEKDGHTIVRCRDCGLVQVSPRPSGQELERLYDEAYFTSDVFHDYVGERDLRTASGARAAQALARFVPGGTLLDVGCAAGFFLHAASKHYDVTGVELSPFASDYARKELGLRVLTGDVETASLKGEQFDVVTMWNTIEHLREPLRALSSVAALTRAGSLLVVSTGDANGPLARRGLERWNLMAPPHHLFFFTRRTIDELLARAGFRTRRFVYDGVVAERGPLASRYARQAAALAGVGNVMTVYAVRDEALLPRGSMLRRVTARWRPLSLARR